MKKVYADLHLRVNDLEHASHLAGKALRLGYALVGVTFPSRPLGDQIELARKTCEATVVKFVSRVDLRPRTPEELLRSLRKFRRSFEIVAVMCESKNVARQAAKDRRVDLLNFPQLDFRRRFFDAAEAELASTCLASLEIDMKSLLTLEGAARIKLLASLRREVTTALDFHVPIVVSSGVSDELLMRKPMELAALASLFDLDRVSALEAVSKNPMAIVNRNRKKLQPGFVAPGIRVVRGGKDC